MKGALALRWGIRSSFLRYVAGLADGRTTATGGAVVLTTGQFLFVISPVPQDQETTGELRFRGDVRCTGHFGMLSVRIADPWLRIGRHSGTLSVADGGTGRLDLATFRPPQDGAAPLWTATEVRLTAAGAGIFGDVYAADEQLDDLEIGLLTEPPSG